MQANIRIFIINPTRRRYLGVKLHFYIIFILCFVTLVVRAQYDVLSPTTGRWSRHSILLP